ncbi:hypothetical protein DFH06DRAFT_1317112 [Mycena polygramma]|nr:hypothetical protein DFH06DRAFT_1317112 [Mycena polygramma]
MTQVVTHFLVEVFQIHEASAVVHGIAIQEEVGVGKNNLNELVKRSRHVRFLFCTAGESGSVEFHSPNSSVFSVSGRLGPRTRTPLIEPSLVAPEMDLFGASTSSDTDWYTFCASYSRRAPRTPVVAKMNLYLFISPYTFIPTAPLTFVTYFAEDFRNPAIVAEVEAHNMPWNKHCFAIVTPIKKDICGKEVLMLNGSLQGRWTVEEKVYETDMHAFIRIKDRRRRLLAVMAFPRHRVEMPTPSEFTRLFYKRILKEPATTAHTQDITEPVLDGKESYIGERFVELS